MNYRFFAATLIAIAPAIATRASAQTQTLQQLASDTATQPVDHISAIVGSKAILWSQVTEETYAAMNGRSKGAIPDPSKDSLGFMKAVRRYVDTLVAFELFYQEAQNDTTIKVTDQEVSDAVDQIVNNARKSFKSEAEFRAGIEGIGFASLDDWRKSLTEIQRRTLTVNRFRQQLNEDGKIKPVTPSEKEMRAYYNANVDMFPPTPPTVSFKQIVIAPKPSPEARAKAMHLADSLVALLRAGTADFPTLARRYSMDEVTKADSGNLPWFARGVMVREFEDAAFAMQPGQISNPVESPFGFHIIQVLRVNPSEVRARHILIVPEVDSAAAQAAHDRATEIAALVSKGASFDSLQQKYHDRAEELDFPIFPVTEFANAPNGTAYAAALANVDSGQVTKVFELPVRESPMRSKWAVAMVYRRTKEGPISYEDIKERLRHALGETLGEQRYINQLRAKTYVDIREQ